MQGTSISVVRLSHATLVTDPVMDDIPEATPIPKATLVGGIAVTTSHAPGDFFVDFEGDAPVPLSWAMATSPGTFLILFFMV